MSTESDIERCRPEFGREEIEYRFERVFEKYQEIKKIFGIAYIDHSWFDLVPKNILFPHNDKQQLFCKHFVSPKSIVLKLIFSAIILKLEWYYFKTYLLSVVVVN